MGAHALASSISDQITRHNVNTNFKNNDDSRSFEAPRKIITVLPILVIQSPQKPHQIYPNSIHLENSIYFQILVETIQAALTKVMETIF